MNITRIIKQFFSKAADYLTPAERKGRKRISAHLAKNGLPGGKARVIAFYLPQYHPVPENDEWWGKGFTEWTNVAMARPLFRGHHQPVHPSELGYYDLRLPEVREQQAALAGSYGLEGFCYWHYWFGHGRRILELPFSEVLASGKPGFPFCLAWANESWTGRWHGLDEKVLLKQEYPGVSDDVSHFMALREAFADPRYMKVNGRNIFLVYKPSELPDPARFTGLWRRLAGEQGLPGFYFIGISQSPYLTPPMKEALGRGVFDGFMTNGPDLPEKTVFPTFAELLLHRITGLNPRPLLRSGSRIGPEVYSYRSFVRNSFNEPLQEKEFPLVIPNWDNTPRTGRKAWVLQGSCPALFGKLMGKALKLAAALPEGENLVFVKSWNEWAEGNYLEPDLSWGRQYLETMKAVLDGSAGQRPANMSISRQK